MQTNKASYFKRLMNVLLVMTMVTIFGGINAEAGKITMKFAHQNNTFDADQLLAETFKDLVEAKTDGEIEVTIFPGTLTNSEEEAIEFLKMGSAAYRGNERRSHRRILPGCPISAIALSF